MNLLITGGSGFIGRNLILYLHKQYPGYSIVNLDRQEWQSEQQQYTFIEGDVRKQEIVTKVISENNIEVIINLVHDQSGFDIKQLESNVGGQQVLLEAARLHRIGRFIYLSSDSVYASQDTSTLTRPVSESEELTAHSLEGAHRIAAETLARAYFYTYQIPLIILRPADCLGPWLNPVRLSYLLISNSLLNNPLPLYNDGKKVQEWIHVDDLCLAVDKAIHLRTLEGEIFNLGWGTHHSLLDMAKLILTQLGKPESLLRFMNESEKPIFSKPALDSAKAKKMLGWEPKITFTDALQKTVKWFQENPQWWEKT